MYEIFQVTTKNIWSELSFSVPFSAVLHVLAEMEHKLNYDYARAITFLMISYGEFRLNI